MWIMMAFNYRADLCEPMRQVENVGEADSLGRAVTMGGVCNWYDHVVDEALTFHRFSSLMLMSLSLCTKPYFVTVLNNDENPFLTITLFMATIPPVLFGSFLLAVAATTTSMSEKLHVLLCSLAARDARDQSTCLQASAIPAAADDRRSGIRGDVLCSPNSGRTKVHAGDITVLPDRDCVGLHSASDVRSFHEAEFNMSARYVFSLRKRWKFCRNIRRL